MWNKPIGRYSAIACALCLILATGCSSVFTSSLNGRIVDMEESEAGRTVGVADASVFLYTDESDWRDDYNAYRFGDESSLPNAPGRANYRYFQSTVTDNDGRYQFNGLVWKTLAPQFGKTADRRQVFLLIYHQDYGLWRNPVPLFVVSDVTAQLDLIRISDLWHEARVAGRVLDWSRDGTAGLGGVTVNFYVAEDWDYSGDDFVDIRYASSPAHSATSDADGYYQANLRLPVRPSPADDRGRAPVRVSFSRSDYRANELDGSPDGTDINAVNNVGTDGGIQVDADLNNNGRAASDGDWADAYLQTSIEKSGNLAVNQLAEVQLQRHRFTAQVGGRVRTTTGTYLNGVSVSLGLPDLAGEVYYATSAPQTSGSVVSDGHFSFGSLSWRIGDITDPADQKTGRIAFVTSPASAAGGPTRLQPDQTNTLELVQP